MVIALTLTGWCICLDLSGQRSEESDSNERVEEGHEVNIPLGAERERGNEVEVTRSESVASELSSITSTASYPSSPSISSSTESSLDEIETSQDHSSITIFEPNGQETASSSSSSAALSLPDAEEECALM